MVGKENVGLACFSFLFIMWMACNFHGYNLLYFFSFFSRGFNQSPLAIVFSLMNLLRLIKSEKLHHYAGHSFLHSPRPSRIRSIILLFIHILFMVVTHHSFQSSASLLLTRPFVISFTHSDAYTDMILYIRIHFFIHFVLFLVWFPYYFYSSIIHLTTFSSLLHPLFSVFCFLSSIAVFFTPSPPFISSVYPTLSPFPLHRSFLPSSTSVSTHLRNLSSSKFLLSPSRPSLPSLHSYPIFSPLSFFFSSPSSLCASHC